MLLILLAAITLFPVDREHHHTVGHPGQHVTLAVCAPSHHDTGVPVPVHGHRHESDAVSDFAPRARLAVPDAVVAACRGASAPPVLSGTAPASVVDVDLTLLGVSRV